MTIKIVCDMFSCKFRFMAAVLAVVSVPFMVSSCNGNGEASAEDVARMFMNCCLSGDMEGVHEYCSPSVAEEAEDIFGDKDDVDSNVNAVFREMLLQTEIVSGKTAKNGKDSAMVSLRMRGASGEYESSLLLVRSDEKGWKVQEIVKDQEL